MKQQHSASRSRAPSAKRGSPAKGRGGTRWSKRVTETSNALDLKGRIFSEKDPRRIARSLKRSAERSDRRRSAPFRSAMSMLTFYMNRAGKNLPAGQKSILRRAKDELRAIFRRGSAKTRGASHDSKAS